MSEWPFKSLTSDQAWECVYAGEQEDQNEDALLDNLDSHAQKDLAGLSAFGKSGDQPELLMSHVDPITMGRARADLDPKHVRSALVLLQITEPS